MAILDMLAPYMEYIIALVILAAAFIFSKGITVLLSRYVSRIAKKTKSELDDMLLAAVSRPLFWGIILGGVYLATRGLGALSAYATDLGMAFSVIFIFYGAYALSRIVNVVLDWYSKEIAAKSKTRLDEHFLPIFKKLGYVIIYGLAILWILGQLGIEITTLIAAMGIGGIAIALALQPTLSNFFSGAQMVLDRPLKIGDYIELDSGDKGRVVDIGWRSTRIRTYGNNLLIIPNSKIADSKIINYNIPNKEAGFIIECGVAYNSDLDKVEKVTLKVAKDVLKKHGGVEGFEPKLRYREFGDSSINFCIIMRTQTYSKKFRARHEFIKRLKKMFDKERIEIAFPQLDVHLDNKRKPRRRK